MDWTDVSYFAKDGTSITGGPSSVALTDGNGVTKTWNGAAAVDSKTFGAAYAVYTLKASTTAYPTLASQSYTLTITAEGNVRLVDEANNANKFTQGLKNAVTTSITFGADGKGSIGSSNAGFALYVSLAPNNTGGPEWKTGSESGYNNEPLHSTDKISVTAS